MFNLTIPETFSLAVRQQGAGLYDQAEALYRRILEQDPGHVDALHCLGLANYQVGRPQEGLDLVARSIQMWPAAAHFHYNLGKVFRELGRWDESVTCYEEAIRLKPDYAAAYNNLGVTRIWQKKLEEAEVVLKRAIELGAGPDAICNLADVYRDQKKYDLAISQYQKAIALRPDSPAAHKSLALCYSRQGRMHLAMRAGQKAVALSPDDADACHTLGLSYAKIRQFRLAIETLRKAVALAPDNIEALCELAGALENDDQLEEAGTCCRKAIALKPEFPRARLQLGIILTKQERLEEAIAEARSLLPGQADSADLHLVLGVAYHQLNQLDAAITAYERAIELNPTRGLAYWNKALAILLGGDLLRGWLEYEWRWYSDDLQKPGRRDFKQPRWDGSLLCGQTILIHAEQGFGDTFHFLRYIPMVRDRGGRVILECQRELKSLLAGLPAVAQVVARGEPLPEFDTEVPLLNLPVVFETTLATIPSRVPYIGPPADLVRAWKDRLASTSPEGTAAPLQVGLAWAGNPAHKKDCSRSLPLASLQPLAGVHGVQFYSLQKGAAAKQIAGAPADFKLVDLGDQLDSFADTAAVIANLDLVISVDTSVAHLAGALGKPVFLMLPFAPDWRWLLDRSDSPWYPTMTLFRQPRPGDWTAVVSEVVGRLRCVAERGLAST